MVRLSVNPSTKISERARKRDVRRGWIGKREKNWEKKGRRGRKDRFRRGGQRRVEYMAEKGKKQERGMIFNDLNMLISKPY